MFPCPVDILCDPLAYGFIGRAVAAAVLVGAISGVVGCFVVVRGLSFFGDALAHSILPGVAIAYIITGGAAGIPLFIGGLVAGVGSALGIGWLTRDGRLKEDTAIGIVFVAMFALGIAIISSDARAYGRDLVHILFGNILGIRREDLQVMAVCGALVVGAVGLFYKELVVVSFDQGLARTLKLPLERLRLLLLVLVAVTIVASLQIVGAALMLAMLVTPAATAQLLTRRMHHMIFLAALLGIISGITGVYISYYLGVATGPAIVLVVTGMFTAVFLGVRIREWAGLKHEWIGR